LVEHLEDRCLPSQYSRVPLPFGPRDINSRGQVVGYAYTGHAAIWQNGTLIDLGSLGGPAGRSIALAINDVGQVVGSTGVTPGASEYGAAFLVTPEDTDHDGAPDRWYRDSNQDGVNDLMTALSAFDDTFNVANDINAAGQVVGVSGNRAVLWQNGNMIDVGGGAATGINTTGQVVGSAGDGAFLINPEDTDGDGAPDRWFRDADNDGDNDLMVGLGGNVATGINETGQVVVTNGYNGGFLWTPFVPNGNSGGMVVLSGPASGGAYEVDLNASAQVVGTTYEGWDEFDAYYDAWIWENGESHALSSSLHAFAYAITDAGWIVGSDDSGGFLLVPTGEQSPPLLTINDVTVTEGHTGTQAASFTVTLSSASTQAVTVAYNTANGYASAGSDYQAISDTLTFAPGETSKTITVLVIGDRLPEPNETFAVNLSSPTNALIADDQGIGTILDDEPRMDIGSATVAEGNSGTRAANFIVFLSAASTESVTVAYGTAYGSATAGGDYQAASGTLTFAPGETSKTITVQVIGDRLPEPNETFDVYLNNPTNAWFIQNQAVGTILDDEPRISIGDVTKAEGKKGQTTLFTFTVTLSMAYDQPVTMSFATANGTAKTSDSDYIAKSGTLTFAPGETTKTITIEVKGDSKREANETFYLDLFGNSSNSLVTKSRGVGTILNDN
jgi:probable HAF family extracellular repeat protein